jgi:hypothetical protein
MSAPLYRDGFVYSLDKRHGLTCFELLTGKKRWDDGNRMTPKGRNPPAPSGEAVNVPNLPDATAAPSARPPGTSWGELLKNLSDSCVHGKIRSGIYSSNSRF